LLSNYDKFPEIKIKGWDQEAWEGYPEILREIKRKLDAFSGRKILAIDCYPGVYYSEILEGIVKPLNPDLIIHSDDLAFTGEKITKMVERNLTDDRVFGVLSCHKLIEFFDYEKIENARNKIQKITSGLVVIYGVGAALIEKPTVLIYSDLARWEIQKRYRSKKLANWRMDNYDEDILRKYKRGYFFEWRIADRHKKTLYDQMDYLLDTNHQNRPKMITAKAFLDGLRQTVRRPFRLVPYFDQGVWGGQWMKKTFNLDQDAENYAWGFDGVPEENSIYLKYGNVRVEIPSINLVFRHPVELLGDKVHARFGTEFPIRFDFLDTMDGENLSLQVHPLTEYIQENFGMHYTQDESYYILEAKEGAVVYLGLKEGIDPNEMIEDLKRAEKGEILFPDEKYINKFPVKKHDHLLIPAGTVHCSGKDAVVLEVSATPYIFTFKLWDWGRVGLDGLPRPLHIEHGEKVIQWDRNTSWVKSNLINRIEKLSEGEGWLEERTGLHEREFIETRRYWITSKIKLSTHESVNVLNLVEGDEAVVESPTGDFDPFIVHYAETFIVPECIKEYTISPYGKSKGKKIAVLKAFVKV